LREDFSGSLGEMVTQLLTMRKAPVPPGVNIILSNANGITQRNEARFIFCLPLLQQPQAFAKHLAGILVASRLNELLDHSGLKVGQDDIAC
jgi:hypothetical protein